MTVETTGMDRVGTAGMLIDGKVIAGILTDGVRLSEGKLKIGATGSLMCPSPNTSFALSRRLQYRDRTWAIYTHIVALGKTEVKAPTQGQTLSWTQIVTF